MAFSTAPTPFERAIDMSFEDPTLRASAPSPAADQLASLNELLSFGDDDRRDAHYGAELVARQVPLVLASVEERFALDAESRNALQRCLELTLTGESDERTTREWDSLCRALKQLPAAEGRSSGETLAAIQAMVADAMLISVLGPDLGRHPLAQSLRAMHKRLWMQNAFLTRVLLEPVDCSCHEDQVTRAERSATAVGA